MLAKIYAYLQRHWPTKNTWPSTAAILYIYGVPSVEKTAPAHTVLPLLETKFDTT